MNRFYVLLSLALVLLAGLSGCTSQAQQKPESRTADLAVDLNRLSPDAQAIFAEMNDAIMADSFPNTTSVLLVHRDTLIYEGYFGYGDRDLLNDTRSSTKSLTALVTGIAVEQGYLKVEDSVFDILEDLAPFEHDGPLKRSITVEDFLTMSSALSCNDNDMQSPGNEENMYSLHRWVRWASDIPVKEDYQRDESGRGPFFYCTAGSFLLGQVIERKTGRTVDEYFREVLFGPMGIKKWQWSQSPTGEFMTGGGLRLRARDLAKIGVAVLHDGVWGSEQVFPADWIERATSPIVEANAVQNYGYQIWRRPWVTACGIVEAPYMSGNGGNAILMIPERDAVIVVTRQHYGRRGMHQQTIRIVENYVLKALGCG